VAAKKDARLENPNTCKKSPQITLSFFLLLNFIPFAPLRLGGEKFILSFHRILIF
jgi:hypothetical protein